MKEDATAVKNTSPEEYEQGRLRYMIAWRDRRIAQLQQENRELRQELPGTGLAADGTAPYVPEKK